MFFLSLGFEKFSRQLTKITLKQEKMKICELRVLKSGSIWI